MSIRVRRHVAFWLSIRPGLALAAIAALAAFLLITLWLRKIPEQFPGAETIGDLVVSVSLSIVAAFVFYVIDIHAREFRSRERVHTYIAPLVKQIMLDGLGFIHSLDDSRQLRGQTGVHYKVTDLIRVLKSYSRAHEHASLLVNQNYRHRMRSISGSINEILVHYSALDPALIDILHGLRRSYLFMRIDSFDTEEELTALADPLLEMLYRLRDLHKYTTKNIPDYFEDENHPDFAMFERYQQMRSILRARRREKK